ncbi:MAG: cyclophilin-like fold protein [Clostridium sp.]|nr:cyclophilin-like fold protein [Clostridium sp.]MCM1398342.1 cyclophilin-like fold protein [Clostridium sp.]MCM1458993.1 cyclophilin-like fold protein [Bacteroides sp.]
MKRFMYGVLFAMALLLVTACGGKKEGNADVKLQADEAALEQQLADQAEETIVSSEDLPMDTETEQDESTESVTELKQEAVQTKPQENKEQEDEEMMINIQIGEHLLTATLEKNSSAEALQEMLSKGAVTIEMNDYAGMEKVGQLPESLPKNDKQINTDAGDLILYQGNSFVIYYDTNSWSLTRLGKINDVTKKELKEILGSGSVTAVLSLPE